MEYLSPIQEVPGSGEATADSPDDIWHRCVLVAFDFVDYGLGIDEFLESNPEVGILRYPLVVRTLANTLRELRGETGAVPEIPTDQPFDFSDDPYVLEAAEALSSAWRAAQENYR